MASKQGFTAVHFSLIVFVCTTVILGASTYLYRSDLTQAAAKEKKATEELNKEQTAHRTLDNDIQTLKAKLGYQGQNIGPPDANGDGTVVGELTADILKTAPGDVAQGSVRELLQKLNEQIAKLNQERTSLVAEKEKLQATILALQGQYQQAVSANEQAREAAEKDRDAAQHSKEEAIAAKDKQVTDLNNRAEQLTLELNQERDAIAKLTAELNERINKLEQINTVLREKKEQEEDLSFDQPDGVVEWVDHNNKLVWINLGEADNLKKRTSFSVYTKGHYGVGHRDKQDIKGSIEVTKIIGPHQAEARITGPNIQDPIAPGDPIYTPLWGSGKYEHVALLGRMDLDSDGRSDRERLHEIIAAAGAVIDLEIDDQGERVPADGHLSVRTKFLILGEIPDISESKPDRKDADKKIVEKRREVMQEAQEQGVRVINLNDFLDYVGYKAKRRLWEAGVSDTWNLRKGARSTGVAPSITTPAVSAGQVAPIYSRNRQLAPPESSGQTSKAYSGKK